MLNQLARLDAHHRLLIGICVALLALGLSYDIVTLPIRILAVYLSYSLTINVLTIISMANLHPSETRQTYKLQDQGRLFILIFAVTAAFASLFAVVFLVDMVKQSDPGHLKLYAGLSVITVISSWTLLHTLFTLRYGHLYYRSNPGSGLNFPDTKNPDYQDFAYVAFGIGMTCQVADVGPTSQRFRRLILLHSLLSFGFNTLIVALSINIVAGLL
ncbi:DUF1345 domain-containing protein [Fibrella sp. HMF5335]|uniref:DUF1345 domain-containing protein n=1 Tax=Fibrella rubiginis TaxID=2817060 RepID=A0A939GES1_9BACT|nr:DUF1345 domain-containing protein [Fibrella rubiginis]MBO0937797.1 DUF1345 domain-containing protein [Fibrella rubiginis]